MAYDCLIVEINDRFVGSITLNRPDQLNTFNTPLAGELYEALMALDQDPKVRVVLIRGAGKAFCAGIDVHELEGKTVDAYRQWVAHMSRPLKTISKMNKPVIAQVHGVAAANGAGLVAAADLAIAAENARIGLTAINVGLNCVVPVVPVSKSVGRKKALEMLFFGEMIKAPAAVQMGLINRAVPKATLDADALDWAQSLAGRSPIALQNAKQAYYNTEGMNYQQQFDLMCDAFARLCTTEDAKEGVAAFFEKRRPVWKEK
jgi:enoyl-CoA hydratase/carnithine racemase